MGDRQSGQGMTGHEIDYEALAQEALRGVVRTVLQRVAQAGKLPGNHHFFIAFDTRADGVGMSKRLKEQYPEEMTIVLQYRFWDLHVYDDRFEVKLTFNSIPERLIIPFQAVKVFFDPSVPCNLQFDRLSEASLEATQRMPDAPTTPPVPTVLDDRQADTPRRVVRPRPVGKETAGKDGAGTGKAGGPSPLLSPIAGPQDDEGAGQRTGQAQAPTGSDDPPPEPPAQGGAQVVKLDTFRKK